MICYNSLNGSDLDCAAYFVIERVREMSLLVPTNIVHCIWTLEIITVVVVVYVYSYSSGAICVFLYLINRRQSMHHLIGS